MKCDQIRFNIFAMANGRYPPGSQTSD